MRDVDFSPDGSYFVLVSTGFVPRSGQIGRASATRRPGSRPASPNPTRPTWINYTGGDTLHSGRRHRRGRVRPGSPALAGQPARPRLAGPGAVSRPGIGAIDPVTGQALAWNPTKDRGVGGKDLLVTPGGLWVGQRHRPHRRRVPRHDRPAAPAVTASREEAARSSGSGPLPVCRATESDLRNHSGPSGDA